jgi:hypothetical protein
MSDAKEALEAKLLALKQERDVMKVRGAAHQDPVMVRNAEKQVRPFFCGQMRAVYKTEFLAYGNSWRLGVKLALSPPLHRRQLMRRPQISFTNCLLETILRPRVTTPAL